MLLHSGFINKYSCQQFMGIPLTLHCYPYLVSSILLKNFSYSYGCHHFSQFDGVNLHFSDDLFEPFSCVHWPCAYSVKLLFKVFSVFLFLGLFLYTSPLSNNMHCGEFTMDCLFTLVCFHEQFLIHSKISLLMPITFVTYLLSTPKS